MVQSIEHLEKNKIQLKVLINNAAIDSKVKKNQTMTNSGTFEHMRVDDWYRHVNVGLLGATLCSKFFGNMISKNKIAIAIFIIWLFNISGILGILSSNSDWFLKLTPLNLLIYVVLIIWNLEHISKKFLI